MDELYQKLVDLYAGCELPAELETELEARAARDPEIARDMKTLHGTVAALRASLNDAEFTEESNQRILMKLFARAGELRTTAPDPAHLQYYLPIQG